MVGSEPKPDTRTKPARVLIADDHELVRDGFKRMLGYEEYLELVGEASNGLEAVKMCRRLKPDLVLMDVHMPGMDGLEATRTIKAEQPSVSVLVITVYENPDYLLDAIRAGAAGYVLKDAPNRQLTDAMRRALAGESPINQELAFQLIQRLDGEAPQSAKPPTATERGAAPTPSTLLLKEMTPREVEVLKLLAQGKTNRQIAEILFITSATVKVHVRRIISKLGVTDRTQAVVSAFELGLVVPQTGP